MQDILIVAGILISGGLMAILPILKAPLDRQKKGRWLLGKFNWVAFTVIGLFIFSVIIN